MSAGTGRSVLLVEDDALLGDLTAEVMRACGAGRVRLATSVGDALEAIDDADYDVVVIDLTLPDGSPEPLARRAEDRGAKVVFFSGASPTEALEGRPLITKPAPPEVWRRLFAAQSQEGGA